MPNFDINSRFNKDANFSQVVFGEDGYVLETELNEMQHIQDEARASLIRESIPSGVLNYFEPTFSLTTPNTFKLGKVMKVNVNGQIITLPENLDIVLNEPPTADFESVTGKVGYREDLVFLEAWKEEVDYTDTIPKFGGEGQPSISNDIKDGRVGVETTRRIQWKWRIRVVDDADFESFKEGLGIINGIPVVEFKTNAVIQGGNSAPVNVEDKELGRNSFFRSGIYYEKGTVTSNKSRIQFSDDYGLFVGGDGNNESKNAFKTADGYCYAIPLFRVKRRNNGEYSVENSNGANRYCDSELNLSNIVSGGTKQLTVNQEFYDYVKVGDFLTNRGSSTFNKYLKVISKDSNRTITIQHITGNIGSDIYKIVPTRPDNVYSNIIDKRDVIDLRHKVSLTGFNYQELLEENFDRLLMGQLNTKEGKKMLKTYHGIRKTPIDANTVFYASFDGTSTPELGGDFGVSNQSYVCSPTGLALKPKEFLSSSKSKFTQIESTGCIEFFINVDEVKAKNSTYYSILNLYQENGVSSASCYFNPTNSIYWEFRTEDGKDYKSILAVSTKNYNGYIHYRLTWKDGVYKVYINGEFKRSDNLYSMHIHPMSSIKFESNRLFSICDLSISNIDRGDKFATLPKDVIDGYATISTAFNEQRQIFGDPIMSQFTREIIKCTGETKRQFTMTQSTSGKWSTGDTIKLKGLADELISGVIDTDTALCNVLSYGDGEISKDKTKTDTVLKVDSASKLKVGDEICIVSSTLNTSFEKYTVQEIVGNLVTLNTKFHSVYIDEYCIIETTASSSSPVLQYMDGSTLKSVVGTWTGLGTKECTFTFGENATLTNQDLEIQYSLNALRSQSGISEVLTETLGGEYKGQKLTKQDNLTIIDDFKGKIINSLIECPHTYDYSAKAELVKDPSSASSPQNQGYYDRIMTIDGLLETVQTPNIGNIPQQIFKFDLIRIIEDKFGDIPSLDKVRWIKNNVSSITANHYGFGTSKSGSKLTLAGFNIATNDWCSPVSHLNSSIAKCSWSTPTVSNLVDSEGKCYFIVYTNATEEDSPSRVATDYVSIEIRLKVDLGFDVLAPDNTRRDAVKSGALLVSKETREVRRYPLGSAKEDSQIVTYGDYTPSQSVDYLTNPQKTFYSDCVVLSTLGTLSKPHEKETVYKNAIYNVSPSYCSLCSRDRLTKTSGYITEGLLFERLNAPHYNGSIIKYIDVEYGDRFLSSNIPFIAYSPRLITDFNGNIYMEVSCRSSTENIFKSYGIGGGTLKLTFKLYGVPLVKEVF